MVVPPPSALVALIVPLCAVTTALAIASPRPVPCGFPWVTKGSKILCKILGGIPIPVSDIWMTIQSSIKSVPDLKGKIVGLNGFSTSGHLWLWAALGKHGLSDADVTIAPIPFSAMQEALIAGKIDVGEFPQPFAALLEKDAPTNKVFDAKYGLPFDEELDVIIGKEAFLKKNSIAVRAFLEDLKDAMRFYLEQPKEARQLLIDSRMVRVSPDVYLEMKDYYRDPTLRPDLDALMKMQEFQVKAGFQKNSIDMRSLVDPSYLPN